MAWQQRAKTRLSHADLLEISWHDPDNFEQLAEGLGFEKKQETQNENNEPKKQGSSQTEATDNQPFESNRVTTVTDRPAIPFFYIARRERTAKHINPTKPETPQWLIDSEPLTEDELYDKTAPNPKIQALTRAPKLWGQLRGLLKQSCDTQEPDITKIIKKIEKGESLQKVPFKQSKRRISRVLVLADNAKHLKTAQSDYKQLYAGFVKLWGKEKIQWQTLIDRPMGKVRCYKNNLYNELSWRVPTPDTAIIILSDCGSLGETQYRQQWQTLLKQLNRQNRLTLVLAPADLQELQSLSFKGVNAFSWDSYLPKIRKAYISEPYEALPDKEDDVEQILTYLAFSYRIEPGLLRAIRFQLGFNVSVEARCRLHSDVIDDGQFLYIKQQALDSYRIRFKRLENTEKQQAIDWVRYYHAKLPRSILDQELVNAQKLCNQKIPAADESLRYLQRLSKTFAQQPKEHLLRCWSYNYIQEQESGQSLAAAIFTSLYHDEIKQGNLETLSLPRNVELHDLEPFIGMEQQHQHYRLQQIKDTLKLKAIDDDTGFGFTIAESEFSRKYFKYKNKVVPITPDFQLRIENEDQDLILTIDTGTEILTISRLIKPEWASNIGRDKQGLFIEYENEKKIKRLYYPLFGAKIQKDSYGLYTDLTITNITQRFRYIEPGSFLMGSPENEPEREPWSGKETQHQVTLKEGFWLADTTVTQALFQAVMNEQPSYFNDDLNNPVERVSWDDVQQFIEKLNTLIPGLQARLPSEAQWEYACRAGTTTPFSFGDNIKSEHVNYNGDYPYADAKKGLYREKTVAVKSLPANSWGLYEMHGNVWEWCDDWFQEDLGSHPVTDPKGSRAGADRVLRGGSWRHNGSHVRSAIRLRRRPDYRNNYIGFRLSLGLELQTRQAHTGSQQVKSRRDGASTPAGGQGVEQDKKPIFAGLKNLFNTDQ